MSIDFKMSDRSERHISASLYHSLSTELCNHHNKLANIVGRGASQFFSKCFRID